MDSSGIAVIDTTINEIMWQKLPVCGSMFVQDKFARNLLSEASSHGRISICHTRFATTGKVRVTTAHPFYIEKEDSDKEIIGVHNGTISNWQSKANAKEYNVDSEWALNEIYNDGLKAFENFSGAYCFVWWDSDDDKVLNIALNKERTMFVAFTTDGGMAYASEAGMLYWLLERNRLKLKQPIIQLKPDNWYKFDATKPMEFVRTELPAVVYTPVVYTPVYNYNHKSIMDKVGEVLAKASASPEAKAAALPSAQAVTVEPNKQLVTTESKPRIVSKEEVKMALDYGIQNQAGYFIPEFIDDDTDELHGTYVYGKEGESELDGIIRNATALPFDKDTIWPVTTIGMMDDNERLVVICSRPRLQLVAKVANDANASGQRSDISNEATVH